MEYKTAQEYFADMLSAFRAECGLPVSEGSEPALRLYALAAQLETLCHEVIFLGRQVFPQTAMGEYLDRHSALRGIARLGASAAVGSIRFYTDGSSNIVIPSGTVCVTPSGTRYLTTEDVTAEAGVGYADAPAVAEKGGLGGNCPSGAVTTMAIAPIGVSGCTNPAPFTGGLDEEPDEDLRARVLHSFKTLPGGANASYYEAEAMAVEGVRAARVIPRPRGRGSVDVCIASAAGLPDGELLEKVRTLLADKREIAVDVGVIPPNLLSIDVAAEITVAPSHDTAKVIDACKKAAISFFDGSMLGAPFYAAPLSSALLATDGVLNVRLLSPADDTAAEPCLLPILGQLEVWAV